MTKKRYRASSRRSRRHREFEEAAAGPKEDLAAVIACERRALLVVTLAASVGLIMWIICVGTEQWVNVTAPGGGIYVNRTRTIFLHSNMGLFRWCKTFIPVAPSGAKGEQESTCSFFKVFPSEEEIRSNIELDRTILEYTRSEVAFCVISLFLLIMGIGFSLYTFIEPRYMYKRLAGGVHFLCAGVMVVIMEVESNSATYEEKYLSARHPKGCRWSYGFSYYLSWVTFCVFIVSGITFIVCSRKRKNTDFDTGRSDDLGTPGC
ncbi:uncharacterized protein LOC135392112 isoform X2 [Ornithodoros turicata]|uniref:uncharacterized protein LOC135392112 isoform X2 n=1 Tax=Ornithodoros turicata TaxID=34597 RepID=UPI0031397918